MDFDAEYYVASGQRVTRRLVDPIKFTCSVDLDFSPRIEECWYETTCLSLSQPRFLGVDGAQRKKSNGGLPRNSDRMVAEKDSAWNPNFMPTFGEEDSASKKQQAADRNSGKGASLGSFFQKSAAKAPLDAMNDNHSISSRSMNSRSVSDRSNAERSKSEKKLAEKAKKVRSEESVAMHSIDEMSAADFSVDRGADQRKQGKGGGGGKLGNFLSKGTIEEEVQPVSGDTQSVVSGTSMGSLSISKRRGAERSKAEKGFSGKSKPKSSKRAKDDDDENSITMEEAVVKGEKKFRFGEYNEVFEVSYLPESVLDDLFWSSDELAEFRYEAFLEEAGLDMDEYM